MEKIKALILDALRSDCKKSYTEICRELEVFPYHLIPEIKKIERDIRCLNIIDFNKIGYPIHLGVYLYGENGNLRNFIQKNPYINNAFKLKGSPSYYIEVILKDMGMLNSFFDKLSLFIDSKEVKYLVKDEKREGFVFSKT